MEPKPTKKDIINAGIARARQLFKEAQDQAHQKVDKLTAELHQLVADKLGITVDEVQSVSARRYGDTGEVDVRLFLDKAKVPDITKLARELARIQVPCNFDEQKVRKQLNEKLNGSGNSAVERILANPEAVAALDAVLHG